MTQDQLSRANKLQEQIADTEKMIFNMQQQNNCIVQITAYGGDCMVNKDARYYLLAKDELHTIILDYFKKQVETLWQEFDNL